MLNISETAWEANPPRGIADTSKWLFHNNYTWQASNELHFGPEGTSHLNICGALQTNLAEIFNISGESQEYALQNPNNPQKQWLYGHIRPNVVHRIELTGPTVKVYYKL
jgi:hypothetical protein